MFRYGGYGCSGSDGGGGLGSSKMEEQDARWRPHLNWEKPAEEEIRSAGGSKIINVMELNEEI